LGLGRRVVEQGRGCVADEGDEVEIGGDRGGGEAVGDEGVQGQTGFEEEIKRLELLGEGKTLKVFDWGKLRRRHVDGGDEVLVF